MKGAHETVTRNIRRRVVVGSSFLEWRSIVNRYWTWWKRLFLDEEGPTAVEYAVMLALIIVVCIAVIGQLGSNAQTTFSNVATAIGS